MASQITSISVVYWTIYSGSDQRKNQSSASLAFVWGIHRWPVNSPHKGPVTRKMFPFDDVIMINSIHPTMFHRWITEDIPWYDFTNPKNPYIISDSSTNWSQWYFHHSMYILPQAVLTSNTVQMAYRCRTSTWRGQGQNNLLGTSGRGGPTIFIFLLWLLAN